MFEYWEADDGAAVQYLDLNVANAQGALVETYGIAGHAVLNEVISHAISLGAQTVAVEYRYIDADYRDEHAKFWSGTFRRYPSVAHRLHFFKNVIDVVNTEATPFHFEAFDYLGYSVMRPIPAAPVGRTVLLPPATEGGPVILCDATDSVNLLGSNLDVRGVPFYSQDNQLTRCGQAAMLSTGYYYHLAFGEVRMLPGGIAHAAGANAGELGRWVPSPGVTLNQLVDTATAMRVPPVVYPVASLTDDIETVVCRYLNSKFPVTVFTRHHAFLLIGYQVRIHADGTHTVSFLRHDDEVGPYKWVTRDELDGYGDWQYLVVPLPPKVYMVAERAEAVGEAQFNKVLPGGAQVDQDLHARIATGEVVVRSAAVTSNAFKRSLIKRGYPDDVSVLYQAIQMSRYIWVIELTEKAARNAGERCVYAEVIVDATDHPESAKPLAWRIPSGLGWNVTDTNRDDFDEVHAMSSPVYSVITHIQPDRDPN